MNLPKEEFMKGQGKLIWLGTGVLPMGALALYLTLGPTTVAYADTVCYYGGQAYSQGANIHDACQGTQVQTCSGGAWGSCH